INNLENKHYEVLLITGKGSYEEVIQNRFPSNVKILPFYEGLSKIMKRTDLMVSRAGASTLSEIIALEIPTILIPSPYVANNHQYVNALDLIKNDAAIMIEEKDLKDDILIKTIDSVIDDSVKLHNLRQNLKKLRLEDSALKIYSELKRISND
ncbi:MAG: UDP-N-acetylglucosamine--N-acetylmuramyl-(pentapeptide) pyrophosphoryl-undecaprenol N-acetylglucosamine transferase, partial [Bacilli bacterium]|nr:UDP-N-acetylglucosamine--N-acetylmuramyl-(pentapeptide) pyrophosphoryl-undecaprenol N-acetylglucosamine transferase [Bacilli bacterium]